MSLFGLLPLIVFGLSALLVPVWLLLQARRAAKERRERELAELERAEERDGEDDPS
ncbi:MAG: hypothetical protein Q4B42_00535 [Oscillospiraceae bacterium]|nr:hypothetical protein [Oscillospiraceae bacterium]